MISAIIVDSREPDHIKALFPDAATQLLDAGDVWVATDDAALLVIERKTPSDLLHTIAENRLFSQCARMREVSPWAYLLITGALVVEQGTGHMIIDYKVTGWNYASIQGALLSCQELGVMVVHSNGEEDYAECVQRLANRSRGEIKITAPRSSRILSIQEQILAAFPGIGLDKAMAIMRYCGSLKWALNWLTVLGEDGVEGVGDGIKRGARRTLELEEGEQLWPVVNQDGLFAPIAAE